MEKKSKKSIVIGISVLLLVTLTLLGLTYAYYRTRVIGNESEQSISVTSKKLEIAYGDGNGFIEAHDFEPGDTLTKTFTVTNNGDEEVRYYVYLLNVVNEFTSQLGEGKEYDMTYELVCDSQSLKSGNYPQLGGQLVENTIAPNEEQTYTFTLTYKYLESIDQSDDMGKKLSGLFQIYTAEDVVDLEGTVANAEAGDYVQINSEKKTSMIIDGKYRLSGVEAGSHTLKIMNKNNEVKASTSLTINKGTSGISGNTITISDEAEIVTLNITNIDATNASLTVEGTGIQEYYNPYKEGTLAYNIIENTNSGSGTKYVASPLSKVAAEISGENEKVLSKTADDYGVSYYYRGNVEDNYVNYNGMCWKVVRIEGDGSTKLILEDKDAECNSDAYTGNWAIGKARYGVDKVDEENNIHKANYLNPSFYSNASQVNIINTWYTESNFDESELKEDTWCLGNITDVYTTKYPYTKLSNETDTRDTLIESGTPFYYESFTRFGDEGVEGEQYTTLKCEKNNYTSFKSYAAPLTADELIYAGAKQGTENANLYLYNEYQKNSGNIAWWSLTLGKFNGTHDRAIAFTSKGQIGNTTASQASFTSGGIAYARPAITLKKDIMVSIESGNGSKTSPYVIG